MDGVVDDMRWCVIKEWTEISLCNGRGYCSTRQIRNVAWLWGECSAELLREGLCVEDPADPAEPEEPFATSYGMALDIMECKGWRTSYQKSPLEVCNLPQILDKLRKKRQFFLHLHLPRAIQAMRPQTEEQGKIVHEGMKSRRKAEDEYYRVQRHMS